MTAAERPVFEDVPAMLQAWRPAEPVYCIRPAVYRDNTHRFLKGFPGRVLYAVKVNDDPQVIELLHAAGVKDFDCASLPEVQRVKSVCPDARCYFMIPVWLRGAPGQAFREYGVRHFVVDHQDGISSLASEVPLEDCVVFVRMAVHHASALNDLSVKFGATPEETPGLMRAVSDTGAEPALAFNVGSAVTDPQAYGYAMDLARGVLQQLPFRTRLLDIGGGYPFSYPGFEVPPIEDYCRMVANHARGFPLAEDGEILTEPGRALAAPGMSVVVEVLQRKGERLYINDGGYGVFWELRFEGHDRYPVQVFRDGVVHDGPAREFRLFGPTCDAFDVLRGAVALPEDIQAGDYLEFDHLGAYSLSGRTRFNGHWSDRIVTISNSTHQSPG